VAGSILDSLGMFELVAGLPEQFERAVFDAASAEGLPEAAGIRNVLVLGMGGSAMAGEVLAAVAADQSPVPVIVWRGYEPPRLVGPSSLVFAVSASGETEETLEATRAALEMGARVVVVCSGGTLATLAAEQELTHLRVPAEIPQPRAALGALAAPLVVAAGRIGLLADAASQTAHAVEQLKRRRDEIEAAGESSMAADLARRIGRTVVLIHGGGPVGAAAALRWKTQVNENAKAPAFWSAQPELCHNEVCGWAQHGDVTRQVLTVVALRHSGEHPRVAARFGLVSELLQEVVAGVLEVRAAGAGELAQLLDLVLIGDYVSLWMAAQAGVDPGPVPVLVELKHKLAALAAD
jgi:glucose/mannose-6-phosphate isomerase